MSKESGGNSHSRIYSDFGEYLLDEGVASEIKGRAEKRLIAMKLEARRKECGLSKSELARRVGTSRTQLDRILDPYSQNVTLKTLRRVAEEMGKRIHISLVD